MIFSRRTGYSHFLDVHTYHNIRNNNIIRSYQVVACSHLSHFIAHCIIDPTLLSLIPRLQHWARKLRYVSMLDLTTIIKPTCDQDYAIPLAKTPQETPQKSFSKHFSWSSHLPSVPVFLFNVDCMFKEICLFFPAVVLYVFFITTDDGEWTMMILANRVAPYTR
ncbi:hypothetical protein IW261DRAFT_1491273 [Armillaria novae-zelandiae]|uniref:Uncharacterized protein n=1 Tax=Armillaria novae-zelandiae TaxID=153914 RepID=A0AA39U7X0_9AGAR|nr:hypothetical protein IW261DRAFT_1491273 [Armillaria novae-zelandiae]